MTIFKFEILHQEDKARAGRVHTAHGTFETPCFMATATAATIKAVFPDMARSAGAELAICNTYHLMLRPTAERVAKLGGLHKFMDWPGPIVTDSGGFQVMSLAKLRTLSENGVTFQSHIDGSKHELTPERSMQIQHLLDSDITMALDECTPFPCTHEEAEASMKMSMRWAERCKKAFVRREGYALFGINQGNIFPDLRQFSAEVLNALDVDGYGIGGLAIGEGQEAMFRTLDETIPALHSDKPRYLMGVGNPDDIVGAVLRGVDMFDCVIPTRSGRTGKAWVTGSSLNIRNAQHMEDARPLDEECTCLACMRYSRAYLHHLFRNEEILGAMLLSLHNTHYYQKLMRDLREAIAKKALNSFAAAFYEKLKMENGVMRSIFLCFCMLLALVMSDVAFAGGVRAPGKEIPRFVSLREEQTSVRTGPGGRYPTDWVYKKQALPVEVVAEHDVWLRIRDPHGDMGWVRRTAVSSKRTIFVSADSAKIYKGMSVSSGVIANVEAGAIGQVVSCEMSWCKIKFPEAKGFMRKPEIWGVYDDEFI